jgi:hypothetical protein
MRNAGYLVLDLTIVSEKISEKLKQMMIKSG